MNLLIAGGCPIALQPVAWSLAYDWHQVNMYTMNECMDKQIIRLSVHRKIGQLVRKQKSLEQGNIKIIKSDSTLGW